MFFKFDHQGKVGKFGKSSNFPMLVVEMGGVMGKDKEIKSN
jgi:hypothetical protein